MIFNTAKQIVPMMKISTRREIESDYDFLNLVVQPRQPQQGLREEGMFFAPCSPIAVSSLLYLNVWVNPT